MGCGRSCDLLDLASLRSSVVAASKVAARSFRVDASAFVPLDESQATAIVHDTVERLSDLAEVYTVYIQTPVLHYVEPFSHSCPYLTTSELGEYQQVPAAHVSLLTDPRLIEWEIRPGFIVLSRSGRVGEAYWIDKKLGGALVGDSFRVVPKDKQTGHFLYALLSSPYAKQYMTGASYGSVVDHASVDQTRTLPIPKISAATKETISDCIADGLLAREEAYSLYDEALAAVLKVNGLPLLVSGSPREFDPLGQPVCFDLGSSELLTSNGRAAEYRLDAHFYNPTAQLAVANIKKCGSEVKTLADVTQQVWMGARLKRNYVESPHGVPFLSGKNIVQIRPTDLKYLATSQIAEMQELILKRSWILITRSGTIGRTCFVWDNYEGYAASEHILRVIPNETEIDPGYLCAFVSSHYGYEQILRYRHGSVIDEVTDKQIERVLVPRPPQEDQVAIGELVRKAYEKRAEAIRLEDEAQEILMREFTNAPGTEEA